MPSSPTSPPQRKERLIRVLAIFALLLLAVIQIASWYHNNFYTHAFRYRLTMEIEAAGAVQTGTGVIEVVAIRQPWPLPRSIIRLRGQAVAIGLGQHGMVLATLADGASPPAPNDLQAALTLVPLAFGLDFREVADLVGHRRKLVADGPMPALAWLPDPTDVTTMRLVTPAALPTVIAPDIRLRGIWAEITGDSVTTDLFTQLPWLAERIGQDWGRGAAPGGGPSPLPIWTLSRGVDP